MFSFSFYLLQAFRAPTTRYKRSLASWAIGSKPELFATLIMAIGSCLSIHNNRTGARDHRGSGSITHLCSANITPEQRQIARVLRALGENFQLYCSLFTDKISG